MEPCDGVSLLEEIAESLHQVLADAFVGLVLFGSRARGEAHESSDWDVLLIARDLPRRTLERHWLVKRALPPLCRGVVSVIAKTPEELSSSIAPLYLDIALDGKIVRDPYGDVARWLADLRRLLRANGLRREHTEAGDIWQWDKQPTAQWSLEWRP